MNHKPIKYREKFRFRFGLKPQQYAEEKNRGHILLPLDIKKALNVFHLSDNGGITDEYL